MYTQVLLAMLKRDLIEEPFSQQPEPGLLPTMPPYMVMHCSVIILIDTINDQCQCLLVAVGGQPCPHCCCFCLNR